MPRNSPIFVRLFRWPALVLSLVLTLRGSARADFLEKAQDALSLSDPDHRFHLQLSGLFDLETYFIDQPAPALILTDHDFLLNPRLTLFLDAQIGSKIYVFAQTRVDRGFDPSDGGAELRLDEYFVRYSPARSVNFQIGQFATVVGNWVSRHDSWQNPFINAPLPYENLTGIWDSEAPENAEDLLYWAHVPEYDDGDYSDKYLRLPIIWGPSYASGLAVSGSLGRFDYAAEMKNAALASRPESWSITQVGFGHPTFNTRVGFRPNEMWNLGFSASAGPYLLPVAAPTLPSRPRHRRLSRARAGAGSLLCVASPPVMGGILRSALRGAPASAMPTLFPTTSRRNTKSLRSSSGRCVGTSSSSAPSATRMNAQKWGNDIWRIDAALGYRFTDYLQGKVQYSFSQQDSAQEGDHLVAAQLTVKF